jgi:hypothetical protein
MSIPNNEDTKFCNFNFDQNVQVLLFLSFEYLFYINYYHLIF